MNEMHKLIAILTLFVWCNAALGQIAAPVMGPVRAVSGGGGTIFTATSCSTIAVQAAITAEQVAPLDGDIISIPSGTCVWTSGITQAFSTTISILGTGTPNTGTGTVGAGTMTTTIIDNGGTSSPLLNLSESTVGKTLTIGQMNIEPFSSSTSLISPIFVGGTCTSGGCPNVRVTNINFSGWAEDRNGTASSWMIRTSNLYGVMDHNSLSSDSTSSDAMANVAHASWLGVGYYGDNSWTQPDTFGSASALYFENNLFTNGAFTQDCDENDNFQDTGGCRIVVRYNTYTNNTVSDLAYFHGTDSTGRPRGGRQAEIYNNTFQCANGSQGCQAMDFRSGTGMVYGNSFSVTAGGFYTNLVGVDVYRGFASFGSSNYGWCSGQGGFDTNDGTVYASGTFTGVSVAGGTLTVTDSTKSWTSGQWVSNGSPYSIVDTDISDSQTNFVNPAWEITASASNSVSASAYGSDYYNGPPTITVGDHYQILRASLCLDQPGRNLSAYIHGLSSPTDTNATPVASVNESLDPIYEWEDTIVSGSVFHGAIGSSTQRLIANRDFYNESISQTAQTSPTSPFDGTSGTGHGTLANRPTTCTPQVAYWATDTQTLYQCMAVNTWSSYYTPYQYPYPY
jgi:hypothetical protein